VFRIVTVEREFGCGAPAIAADSKSQPTIGRTVSPRAGQRHALTGGGSELTRLELVTPTLPGAGRSRDQAR